MSGNKNQPLLRLWHYARQERRSMLLASTYSVLNKLFDLAPPVLIGTAVDVVVRDPNAFMARVGLSDPSAQLRGLALITFGVWGMESVFEYLYARRWRGIAQDVQHRLRLDTYRNVQRLDAAFFEDQHTGGLLAILNDDVNQLERFLDNGANQILQLCTTLIAVGALFIVLVPELSWMTLLPMPLVVAGSIWFQRKLEPHYARVRTHAGLLSAELSNSLGGLPTIRSFVAERQDAEKVSSLSAQYSEANRSAIALSAAFVPLIRMVIVIGFAAILVYGGQQALAGELGLGTYSILVFMTQRLLWPLTGLGSLLDQYRRAMASAKRILDLLAEAPAIASTDGAPPVVPIAEGSARPLLGLSIREVSFRYREPLPRVLKELSLEVPAGRTVAIVGATGCGKSTLIKLLLRLYEVDAGHILLAGRDLKDLPLEWVRQQIGLVSQDVYLMHGSVRENIVLGAPDATDGEVTAAARAAEAHAFISDLPQGYDTLVGERGQKLSGGQRQRIALARALLKDPPILILDEATSSVDNETEAAIQRSLEKAARGRTMLIVAHRLSTVRHAHRIYVLEDGSVREQGTHDELVEDQSGLYRQLWEVQTGEQKGAA